MKRISYLVLFLLAGFMDLGLSVHFFTIGFAFGFIIVEIIVAMGVKNDKRV